MSGPMIAALFGWALLFALKLAPVINALEKQYRDEAQNATKRGDARQD